MAELPQALHFVGIGGVGMSALALVWAAKGRPVSGTDAKSSKAIDALVAAGAVVHVGHAAEHVPATAGAVVVSTAVPKDNPEVQEAQRRGLPILHRSQVLAALLNEGQGVAVTGTHGKTTTTGMIASILMEAQADPTVLVGGELPSLGSNARCGSGIVVAEADESDKSLRNLSADVAIVTNLEGDHLEHYKDLGEIVEVMATFLRGLRPGALVVACEDDPGVRRLLEGLPGLKVLRYGSGPEAEVRAESIQLGANGSRFKAAGLVLELSVPGHHNVLNATAAVAACKALGVDGEAIARGLKGFGGMKRRFQALGTAGGVTVVDDYAHHPSEVSATLAAAALSGRRVHAVFQPHRHTRLAALWGEFAASFGQAASVAVLPTYSAGERPGPVSAGRLAEAISAVRPGLPVAHVEAGEELTAWVRRQARQGDMVVLMGAGDVYQQGGLLLSALGVAPEGAA